jgi:hypothetical protein
MFQVRSRTRRQNIISNLCLPVPVPTDITISLGSGYSYCQCRSMTCDGRPFYLRDCLHSAPPLGMASQGGRRNRFKKCWVFRNDAERALQGRPPRPPCSSTHEICRPRRISIQRGHTILIQVWVLLSGQYSANFVPDDDGYRLASTVKFLLFSMQASINYRGLYFPTVDTFLVARHITSYLFVSLAWCAAARAICLTSWPCQ